MTSDPLSHAGFRLFCAQVVGTNVAALIRVFFLYMDTQMACMYTVRVLARVIIIFCSRLFEEFQKNRTYVFLF